MSIFNTSLKINQNNMLKNSHRGILSMLAISTVAFIGLPVHATTLLDFNETGSTGTTWTGWTWYGGSPNGADDYGNPGWRQNSGRFFSGNANWMPRINQKNDYGNSTKALIDTTDKAPSTSSGNSLKVYDDGGSRTYDASWWYLFGDNFGTKGLADSNTNRLDFYFKTSGIPMSVWSSDIADDNVHFGAYLCWPGGGIGGEDCPKEADNQHYYHYLVVNPNAWLHVVLDRHPTHQRGGSGSNEPNDNPAPGGRNYFQYMNSFYLEIRYAQSSPTAYWIDEMKFSQTPEPENDISISSIWVGYWATTEKWEIGFSDNSFNSVGYNNSSQSTFEIRYSISPITNANYSSATLITPIYNVKGTGKIKRPNSWKKPAWTQFSLPSSVVQNNSKIYFAIKDVSSTANGDGHNAPSPYIKTIDYSLQPSSSGVGGSGSISDVKIDLRTVP